MQAVPLVDELVVIDSHSTDRTAQAARAAGATVVHQSALLPELGDRRGKGEALWKSLLVTTGDVVAYVDADLREFDAQLVVGLLGPLLTHPELSFVKACYDRPLANGDTCTPRAAAGSPSCSPGRCSTCTGRPSPAWSNRWRGSARPGARCWNDCRSYRGTAWRSRC